MCRRHASVGTTEELLVEGPGLMFSQKTFSPIPTLDSRTEDDSETSSGDSETTARPDSETHPIQKLADSEARRFRNCMVGVGFGWGDVDILQHVHRASM